ncbi:MULTISPECIES: alpha/beta hydrolase [Amniculibacterium]|uniref:alpha/beta hydrolase n=1 Tax=Amniculibacterium TaxID=2715289 RepID=UPI000F5A7FA3|nr:MULTISPECIES: alpha/beta hydrolase-fold protein [Amniculibacterium]
MELKYIVREPETITSKTPILFMLHGYGSNEQDLFSFVPTLPKDWIIVSYRAPKETPFEGYSWYDIDLNDPEKFIDVPQANQALNALLESMLKISNHYGLSDNPTHLCGFSQGGVLSYALALSAPEMFNKIAILSAYPEEKILKNKVKDKKKLERLRFFVSHGSDDAIIPMDWGKKGADLLYDLSCYFSFREYMNGHGINQKNYMDLMAFLEK